MQTPHEWIATWSIEHDLTLPNLIRRIQQEAWDDGWAEGRNSASVEFGLRVVDTADVKEEEPKE